MNIFLDDIRDPHWCLIYMSARIGAKAHMYVSEQWLTVRTVEEFLDAIRKNAGKITKVSFDHDLAEEHYNHDLMSQEGWEEYHGIEERALTGYDAAVSMKNIYNELELPMPEIFAHTMNPAGMNNILSLFK